MKHKTVACASGIKGKQGKLQDNYDGFDDFGRWTEIYALHTRLGFETATEAWEANPTIQSSVTPSDYRRVNN